MSGLEEVLPRAKVPPGVRICMGVERKKDCQGDRGDRQGWQQPPGVCGVRDFDRGCRFGRFGR